LLCHHWNYVTQLLSSSSWQHTNLSATIFKNSPLQNVSITFCYHFCPFISCGGSKRGIILLLFFLSSTMRTFNP
jgi:hypothetical protein